MRFGLKIVILGPFQSPPARGENLDHQHLAWKVSNIVFFRSGFKISIKNTIQGDQEGQICDLLKNDIFCSFQNLSLWGVKILIFEIWLNMSLVLSSCGQGAKLAWNMPFRGSKLPNVWFLPFSLYFSIKKAENHKSCYLAPFLALSMPIFLFSEPSRHPWR